MRILTEGDKVNISRWKHSAEDVSITTQIYTPLWQYLVRLIPATVAPNTITFMGLLVNCYALYWAVNLYRISPVLSSVVISLLVYTYMHLDALDGMHARRTKNGSSLGELFDHLCDSVSTLLLTFIPLWINNVTEPYALYTMVTISMVTFARYQLMALLSGTMVFNRWSGPGEMIHLYILVILLTPWVSLDDILWALGTNGVTYLSTLAQWAPIVMGAALLSFLDLAYLSRLADTVTRNGTWLVVMTKMIEFGLISMEWVDAPNDWLSYLAHGGFYVSLAVDYMVCKMAQKGMSSWVPVICFLSLFDSFISLLASMGFVLRLLYEISSHLRINFFEPQIRVYASGVFDLCHNNHREMFEIASRFGNRLIIGVHGDEDVEKWKGKTPTMNLEQRAVAVEQSPYVSEVIRNPPYTLSGKVGEKFLDSHRISLVVCSDEYDNEDDPYYVIPRQRGILKTIPRRTGLSTSEIKKRIIDDHISTQN